MAEREDFWRYVINSADAPELPSGGGEAPNMEKINREPIKDGESPVLLQKLVTEVYVYTSINQKDLWYGAQTIQDAQVLGMMRLSEAKKIIDTAKKKRRRR